MRIQNEEAFQALIDSKKFVKMNHWFSYFVKLYQSPLSDVGSFIESFVNIGMIQIQK